MSNETPEFATIRAGCMHPVLGNVEGWSGVVTRTFEVKGTSWCDLDLTAAAIGTIPPDRIEGFIKEKIVFTRVRIEKANVVSSAIDESWTKREQATEAIQHQWHELLGQSIADPTKFASDQAYTDSFGGQRRQVLKALVLAGLGILAVTYTTCRDTACNNNGSGSWGRGGGFYA
jgi:hypothetical protein